MNYLRRWIALSLVSRMLAKATQVIPNANQDRLGFPDHPVPDGRKTDQGSVSSKRSHAEALQLAEELLTRAQKLRDDLKKAGEYVVPLASIDETEKIEKLARKIRGQLKV